MSALYYRIRDSAELFLWLRQYCDSGASLLFPHKTPFADFCVSAGFVVCNIANGSPLTLHGDPVICIDFNPGLLSYIAFLETNLSNVWVVDLDGWTDGRFEVISVGSLPTYSKFIQAIFDCVDLGDSGLLAEHNHQLSVSYCENLATSVVDAVLSSDDVAVLCNEQSLLIKIEAMLARNGIALAYNKKLGSKGVVVFIARLLDSVIYDLPLPFYSTKQDCIRLEKLRMAISGSFQLSKIIDEVEEIICERLHPDIRAILLSLGGQDDLLVYRGLLSVAMSNLSFFCKGEESRSCYAYTYAQARDVQESKVIFVVDDEYEWTKNIISSLKDLFRLHDVYILQRGSYPTSYWLFNLHHELKVSGTIDKMPAFSSLEDLRGNEVQIPLERLPKVLSPKSVNWLLYEPSKFYLYNVLSLDFSDKKSEAGEFAKCAMKVLDRCLRDGKVLLENDWFKSFPYLKHSWEQKLRIMGEHYLRLHNMRLKDLAIVRVESRMQTMFNIMESEFSLKVCSDRVEFYKDGRYSLVKFVYGSGLSSQELKLYLSVVAEGFRAFIGDYPEEILVWGIGVDLITVRCALEVQEQQILWEKVLKLFKTIQDERVLRITIPDR